VGVEVQAISRRLVAEEVYPGDPCREVLEKKFRIDCFYAPTTFLLLSSELSRVLSIEALPFFLILS